MADLRTGQAGGQPSGLRWSCPASLRNWNKSEQMDACLDACVIVPIHVHGILVLVEAGLKTASTAIVRHRLPQIAQICSGF